MMRGVTGRIVCAQLVVLLAAGCASSGRRGSGLNSRFIRHADQKASALPSPYDTGAPSDSLETTISKIRELSARARPQPKQITGMTIEGVDPELRGALLALQTFPSAAAHRRVAQAYMRLRVLDAAFDHFRSALKIDARDPASYDGLARIWRDWKLPALALGDARRAVYYGAQSPEAHNTLGTILHALGRRREAMAAYRRSLQLNPRAAYALNNLGYVQLLEGNSRAADYFQLALAFDAGLTAARHNLALAYAAAGRLDLARHELQHADSPAVADYNFGIISLARRDRAAASAAFDAACRARAGLAWACQRAADLRATAPGTEGTP
jgi:tetratricopeptide (TPR) repeat protein